MILLLTNTSVNVIYYITNRDLEPIKLKCVLQCLYPVIHALFHFPGAREKLDVKISYCICGSLVEL